MKSTTQFVTRSAILISFLILSTQCDPQPEPGNISLPPHSSVAGGRATLICNITQLSPTPPSPMTGTKSKTQQNEAQITFQEFVAHQKSDPIQLIIWYKDDLTGTPIFSIDARSADSLDKATVFNSLSKQFEGRLYFDPSRYPLSLVIDPVKPNDAGQYFCRVDFRWSRTIAAPVILEIIVPPSPPIITSESGLVLRGTSGPFNEGQEAILKCKSKGMPAPMLQWFDSSGKLIDDSYEIQGITSNNDPSSSTSSIRILPSLISSSFTQLMPSPSSSSSDQMHLHQAAMANWTLAGTFLNDRSAKSSSGREVSKGAANSTSSLRSSFSMPPERVLVPSSSSSSRPLNSGSAIVSVENTLRLPLLHRGHLHSVVVCEAKSSYFPDPIRISTSIEMNLKPLSVEITTKLKPTIAGSKVEVICESRGSRPPAQITWLVNNKILPYSREFYSEDGNYSKSILEYVPSSEHDEHWLVCKSENHRLQHSTLFSKTQLNILHKPLVQLLSSSSAFLTQNNHLTPLLSKRGALLFNSSNSSDMRNVNYMMSEREISNLQRILKHKSSLTSNEFQDLRSMLFLRKKQVIVKEGSTLILACFVDSNPRISSVNWFLNDELLKTDDNLLPEDNFSAKVLQVIERNFNPSVFNGSINSVRKTRSKLSWSQEEAEARNMDPGMKKKREEEGLEGLINDEERRGNQVMKEDVSESCLDEDDLDGYSGSNVTKCLERRKSAEKEEKKKKEEMASNISGNKHHETSHWMDELSSVSFIASVDHDGGQGRHRLQEKEERRKSEEEKEATRRKSNKADHGIDVVTFQQNANERGSAKQQQYELQEAIEKEEKKKQSKEETSEEGVEGPSVKITKGRRKRSEGEEEKFKNKEQESMLKLRNSRRRFSWIQIKQVHHVMHDGYVKCQATNDQGSSVSEVTRIHVLYSPLCKPGQKKNYTVPLGSTVGITCQVISDPSNVTFEWTKGIPVGNANLNNGLGGKLRDDDTRKNFNGMKVNEKEAKDYNNEGKKKEEKDGKKNKDEPLIWSQEESTSTLLVQVSDVTDFTSYNCYAKNSIGWSLDPCTFHLVQAEQVPLPVHSCSITNVTAVEFTLICEDGSTRSSRPPSHPHHLSSSLPATAASRGIEASFAAATFHVLEIYDATRESLVLTLTTPQPNQFKSDFSLPQNMSNFSSSPSSSSSSPQAVVFSASGLQSNTSYILVIYSQNSSGKSSNVVTTVKTKSTESSREFRNLVSDSDTRKSDQTGTEEEIQEQFFQGNILLGTPSESTSLIERIRGLKKSSSSIFNRDIVRDANDDGSRNGEKEGKEEERSSHGNKLGGILDYLDFEKKGFNSSSGFISIVIVVSTLIVMVFLSLFMTIKLTYRKIYKKEEQNDTKCNHQDNESCDEESSPKPSCNCDTFDEDEEERRRKEERRIAGAENEAIEKQTICKKSRHIKHEEGNCRHHNKHQTRKKKKNELSLSQEEDSKRDEVLITGSPLSHRPATPGSNFNGRQSQMSQNVSFSKNHPHSLSRQLSGRNNYYLEPDVVPITSNESTLSLGSKVADGQEAEVVFFGDQEHFLTSLMVLPLSSQDPFQVPSGHAHLTLPSISQLSDGGSSSNVTGSENGFFSGSHDFSLPYLQSQCHVPESDTTTISIPFPGLNVTFEDSRVTILNDSSCDHHVMYQEHQLQPQVQFSMSYHSSPSGQGDVVVTGQQPHNDHLTICGSRFNDKSHCNKDMNDGRWQEGKGLMAPCGDNYSLAIGGGMEMTYEATKILSSSSSALPSADQVERETSHHHFNDSFISNSCQLEIKQEKKEKRLGLKHCDQYSGHLEPASDEKPSPAISTPALCSSFSPLPSNVQPGVNSAANSNTNFKSTPV